MARLLTWIEHLDGARVLAAFVGATANAIHGATLILHIAMQREVMGRGGSRGHRSPSGVVWHCQTIPPFTESRRPREQ
jgi:hypothetical protein